jgi:hypothetical protein
MKHIFPVTKLSFTATYNYDESTTHKFVVKLRICAHFQRN